MSDYFYSLQSILLKITEEDYKFIFYNSLYKVYKHLPDEENQ